MRTLIPIGLLTALIGFIVVPGAFTYSRTATQELALFIEGVSVHERTERLLTHYQTLTHNQLSEDEIKASIVSEIQDLNGDGRHDILTLMKHESTCGTGGCTVSLFIQDEHGELHAEILPYVVSGLNEIEILNTVTNGRNEMRLRTDPTKRIIWNGAAYSIERI